MQQWYVSPDGRARYGPMTLEQLGAMGAQRQFGPGSLVWREGLPGWIAAAQVPEVAALLPAPIVPPPVPQAPPPTVQPAAPPVMPPSVIPQASSPVAPMAVPVAAASTFGPAGGQTFAPMPATPGDMAPAPAKSGSAVGWIIAGIALAVCCLVAIPVAVLLPALGKARMSARQLKDSTQIRGIHQGMVLWAQNNRDEYPIPSQLDKNDVTISAADGKDLPRHVMSILMYNGYFSPELTVSPAESNGRLSAMTSYQYSMPSGAKSPQLALWDPAFRAVPDELHQYGEGMSAPGNLSYAIMPIVGERRKHWSNTFMSTEAVVGNRGPAYQGGGPNGRWTLVAGTGGMGGNFEVGVSSNTLLIHGGRTTWEGNICYNDNHTNFETMPDPDTLPFRFNGLPPGSNTWPDNLFVDENDSTRAKDGTNGITGQSLKNTNNLLRNWNGGRFDGETGALIDIPSNLWFD